MRYTIRSLACGWSILLLTACEEPAPQTLVTIADARKHPAQLTDLGAPGDSPGDVLTFDQPLLNKDQQIIGTNSGQCIRVAVGHSFQCQWTLQFTDGSIQVAGREFDKGTSFLSIVGGTGKYAGISGEMQSTNNGDGTFTQVVNYRLQQ